VSLSSVWSAETATLSLVKMSLMIQRPKPVVVKLVSEVTVSHASGSGDGGVVGPNGHNDLAE
jgi:hypothetical protein